MPTPGRRPACRCATTGGEGVAGPSSAWPLSSAYVTGRVTLQWDGTRWRLTDNHSLFGPVPAPAPQPASAVPRHHGPTWWRCVVIPEALPVPSLPNPCDVSTITATVCTAG